MSESSFVRRSAFRSAANCLVSAVAPGSPQVSISRASLTLAAVPRLPCPSRHMPVMRRRATTRNLIAARLERDASWTTFRRDVSAR
jgi:hypothetical protein